MSEVLLTGLDILNSHQNHSKNKLVSESAKTQVHGGCLLRVMGPWYMKSNNQTISQQVSEQV